mmetsp:Transcript_72959/g.145061  ORF Transcript_72959/g.145061 Transcript_72959/m.145061 type:complete len:277 (-) Transcript_72959:158-988(-)
MEARLDESSSCSPSLEDRPPALLVEEDVSSSMEVNGQAARPRQRRTKTLSRLKAVYRPMLQLCGRGCCGGLPFLQMALCYLRVTAHAQVWWDVGGGELLIAFAEDGDVPQFVWDVDISLGGCGARLPSWLEDRLPSALGSYVLSSFTCAKPLEVSLGDWTATGEGASVQSGARMMMKKAAQVGKAINDATNSAVASAVTARSYAHKNSMAGTGSVGAELAPGAQARLRELASQFEQLSTELASQQQRMMALQSSMRDTQAKASHLGAELRGLLEGE